MKIDHSVVITVQIPQLQGLFDTLTMQAGKLLVMGEQILKQGETILNNQADLDQQAVVLTALAQKSAPDITIIKDYVTTLGTQKDAKIAALEAALEAAKEDATPETFEALTTAVGEVKTAFGGIHEFAQSLTTAITPSEPVPEEPGGSQVPPAPDQQ